MTDIRLEVYTWQGASSGAIHYYGELRSENGRSLGRLSRPLSERDAISINKRLKFVYSKEYYELYKVAPGEEDYRFDTPKQVIEEAKKQWLTLFPDATRLVDYDDHNVVYAYRETSGEIK